ncbi:MULTISPECIES: hypothetical protein [unclassified Mesorhizobium]|uniref:hypothetical protein n=1 Tax=unclassified Mesorhizobium TaxID=325217 RepID=UPI000FCCB28E|nr:MULTISPECIES: hypothetical protein [unclassified Mesorhizobium]RVD66766.1 hypothetical protein EN750_01860 [Mesorhizobium sp. M7A.F.Ca.ET.027.03.2.1]TIN00220.1 MAG: hypothetical protein E5Y34_12965 [Mesorhizobium sp.]
MTEFVQRLDKRTGDYIKIEVRSGLVIGDPQKRKFPDADEIEPIEIEERRASYPDPLGDYR